MKKRILGGLIAGVMCLTFTVQASAAELKVSDEQLPAACASDWGYKDLTLRSNSEDRQRFYDKLTELYCGLWTSDEDVPLDNWCNRYVLHEAFLDDYGLTVDEAKEVYYAFRMDNPLIFYASSRTMNVNYTEGNKQYSSMLLLVDEDYASAAVRKGYQEQIKEYIAEKAEGIAGLTRKYEIAKYFHDRMSEESEYAYVEKNGYLYADSSVKAHNILGIITEGRGVCESYAKTFELLLSYAGISNVYVVGDAGGSHAWNIIQMDNDKYYNFDATWDDQNYGTIYNYFAKGSTSFDKDHTPYTSDRTGADFCYDLPEVPAEDYDPNDILIKVFGDLDGNGVANMRDLVLLQRFFNGFDTGIEPEDADFNNDGRTNLKDFVFLQRYINGYTA